MKALPQITNFLSLQGKMALVTGAAAGIGQAIASRFAEAGAEVHLVDIDKTGLDKTAAGLRKAGTPVSTHLVDLSEAGSRQELWNSLPPHGPDILVNNAGIYPFKKLLDMDGTLYEKVMEINLNAVYWLCQRMIQLRKKLGGIIINVGSIEALLPFKEDLAHYSVSKAGVIALTRALAKEHARDGFRVNAILPGGIRTQGTEDAAKTAIKDMFRFKFNLLRTGLDFQRRLPAGRLGKPDEVARIALVLASELASYVHGATIPVDGGFLAA